MKREIVLVAGLALAACGTTPVQQAELLTAGKTLLTVAAANNSTVADVLAKGALLCGEQATVSGQLVAGSVVAIASAEGVPASVIGQVADAVAQACPTGLVPGPVPVGQDPASIPVVAASTKLPTI